MVHRPRFWLPLVLIFSLLMAGLSQASAQAIPGSGDLDVTLAVTAESLARDRDDPCEAHLHHRRHRDPDGNEVELYVTVAR